MSPARSYGRRSVELSNLDKVLFPDAGFTKEDILDYYEKLSDSILPHLKGRPLTLQRFPDGIGVEDTATLAFLAQQGVITLHPWTSRAPSLEEPDRMVFDLDPGEEGGFESVRRAAGDLRELLEAVDLTPFIMLTGSKGAHVWVPLRHGSGFDEVRDFARRVTDRLAGQSPEHYTTAVRKEKRKGRLFLDVARNAHGQTAVAPYSLRPLPEAPVATPLEWDELRSVESPRRWTLENVPRRMAQRDDPWAGMGRRAAGLDKASRSWDEEFGG